MHLRNITIECADPYRLADFWSQVTGFTEDPENVNEPDDPEGLLISPDGRLRLLFVRVAEPAAASRRLRLDVVPETGTRDEEVQRLLGLGATRAGEAAESNGQGRIVLADPEGNEFVVDRGPAEGGPPIPALAAASTPAMEPASDPVSQAESSRPAPRAGPPLLTQAARVVSRQLTARLRLLVRLALLLVEGLIAMRIIFKLAGANDQAGFTSFLYRLTSPLVAPFHPVFGDGTLNGHPFEVGSLLAMAVYAALAYIGVRLVRLIISGSR